MLQFPISWQSPFGHHELLGYWQLSPAHRLHGELQYSAVSPSKSVPKPISIGIQVKGRLYLSPHFDLSFDYLVIFTPVMCHSLVIIQQRRMNNKLASQVAFLPYSVLNSYNRLGYAVFQFDSVCCSSGCFMIVRNNGRNRLSMISNLKSSSETDQTRDYFRFNEDWSIIRMAQFVGRWQVRSIEEGNNPVYLFRLRVINGLESSSGYGRKYQTQM